MIEHANNPLMRHIIAQLMDLHNGKLWMGDNFEKKTSSIGEQEVFIKPLDFVHSIAEIIAHVTAWTEDLIKKIQSGIGTFEGSGSG